MYGLALETPDRNRGYFARTASAVLGRVVSRYQAGNALAWARAARAAGLGATAARTAYLSPRGLTNPERKGDIATRVAAALVAAHAGRAHDLVVAAYLAAGSNEYPNLRARAEEHAHCAGWLVGLVEEQAGGQSQAPGPGAPTPQPNIRGAAAALAGASGGALAKSRDVDAFKRVPSLLPLRDRLSLALACRAACSSAPGTGVTGDLLGAWWMGPWIAARIAAQASAAAALFHRSCARALATARAVRYRRAETWVAWTCLCGRLNEAPCRNAAEAHSASVCSGCRSDWVAEGDRYRCRCLVPVPGGSTQREELWLAEVTTVGPPPHCPAPAHSD